MFALNLFKLIVVSLVYLSSASRVDREASEARLQNDVLRKPDRFVSPFNSSSRGLVAVYFYLLNIYEYEYHWNTLKSASFVTLSWTDVRFNWEGTSGDNDIQVLRLPPESIWYPRIKYHGMNYGEYATFKPNIILDSFGTVSCDYPVMVHSPCKRWMDHPDVLSTDQYDCKIYFSVEDPTQRSILNAGFNNQGNPDGDTKESEVHQIFYWESSTYEMLYTKLKLLDSYEEALPNGPKLTEAKIFEVSFKIKLHHATRQLGFSTVIVCGLILAMVQFAPVIVDEKNDRQNKWAFYRLILAFASLGTFMVVGFVSNYVDNDYKFRIMHIANGLVLSSIVAIIYHSMLVILKNYGKLAESWTVINGWSRSDLSDAILATVVLIVGIVTASVY